MLTYQEPSRKIIISRPIDEALAEEVIARIEEINELDFERRQTIIDYDNMIRPIELYINSGGGSVSDGNAIIAAIELSDTPIIGYGLGMVGSMALAIYTACDYRIAHRFCRFLYHSISYGMVGHIKDHEHMAKECDILNRMYDALMLERTKITQEFMDNNREMKEDYFFGVREAVKMGIVDEVIEKKERSIEFIKE